MPTTGRQGLETLRATTSLGLVTLLWIHVPIAVAIGMLRGGDWLLPAILMVGLAVVATGRGEWRATEYRLG
jgi:methyl-accepting chemotaxis protein